MKALIKVVNKVHNPSNVLYKKKLFSFEWMGIFFVMDEFHF
jgi:hypothetical protein